MAAQTNRLTEDIVWAVQQSIAKSYSELHAALRVYSATSIAASVNELLDRGALRLGSEGFEIPSAQEQCEVREAYSTQVETAESSEVPVTECIEAKSTGGSAEAQQPETPFPDAHEGSNAKPASLVRHDADERSASIDDRESEKKSESIVQAEEEKGIDQIPIAEEEEEEEEEEERTLLGESKGSIMTFTQISFLEFPAHIERDLENQGIEAVYQLIQKLSKLTDVLGKDRLAHVLKRLSELSGVPPVNLSEDDRRQLCILSGSSLFYFDWFGVLCSNLSPELDEHEIRERLEDASYNAAYNEPFSFAEFRSVYQETSIAAEQKLFDSFNRKGYPVNGDAFHILMLPSVEEMVDEGAYEDPNELAHDFLKELTGRKTSDNACFGTLRDTFLSLQKRTDGFGSSERIPVVGDECFIRAARRLAELEPCCSFDEDELTLQCLPGR